MMKRLIRLLAVLTLAALLCACAKEEQPPAGAYTQISQEEAKQMMRAEPDCVILDVRTQEEYDGGHIPNAICIPNESIGTADIPALPDKDRLILVYCRSGRRSKEAAQKLADLGYTRVYEFGGIIDWDGETVAKRE